MRHLVGNMVRDTCRMQLRVSHEQARGPPPTLKPSTSLPTLRDAPTPPPPPPPPPEEAEEADDASSADADFDAAFEAEFRAATATATPPPPPPPEEAEEADDASSADADFDAAFEAEFEAESRSRGRTSDDEPSSQGGDEPTLFPVAPPSGDNGANGGGTFGQIRILTRASDGGGGEIGASGAGMPAFADFDNSALNSTFSNAFTEAAEASSDGDGGDPPSLVPPPVGGGLAAVPDRTSEGGDASTDTSASDGGGTRLGGSPPSPSDEGHGEGGDASTDTSASDTSASLIDLMMPTDEGTVNLVGIQDGAQPPPAGAATESPLVSLGDSFASFDGTPDAPAVGALPDGFAAAFGASTETPAAVAAAPAEFASFGEDGGDSIGPDSGGFDDADSGSSGGGSSGIEATAEAPTPE